MGKNKHKKQQRGQQLPTAPVAKAVSAPPTAIIAPTPPSPLPSTPKISPPSVPMAKGIAAAPIGQEQGVVLSRVYDAKGNVRFGRIRNSVGKLITCHSKGGQVPTEGTIVNFSTYQFDNQTVAKVESTVGADKLVTARLTELNKLSVYQLIPMEQWLGASGTDIENADIIGTTQEGMILLYIKNSRA